MNGQMKRYKESLKTIQYKVPDPALSKVSKIKKGLEGEISRGFLLIVLL